MKTTSSTRRFLGIAIPCALLALLLASAPAGVVTNTNDSGPGSLRQVIADATSGETITFDASLSGQTIVLTSGQLTVDKDLDIDASALAGGITVDGNDASRILEFASGTSTLTGLTIVNGRAAYGGGIYNSGTLAISNSTIDGNECGRNGGGIHNSGTLAITNPTLLNTDGDPRNDYAEWFADTDGADPSDWFQVTGSAQGKWMAIRFHTSQDRHYTLRCCPDLGAGNWTDVQGLVRIRAKGGLHTFFVQRPASPACFYRVEPGMP